VKAARAIASWIQDKRDEEAYVVLNVIYFEARM
jgi:hypothetical protein